MKRYRIDKSVLAIGTRPKVEDMAYRRSFQHRTCAASYNGIDLCVCPAVGAHIRAGEHAGTGTKPSDDLIVPLCHTHHMEQEANPGPEWWMENCFKPMIRRQYRDWKQGK